MAPPRPTYLPALLLCVAAVGAQARDWTLTQVLTEAQFNHPSVKLRRSETRAAVAELQTAHWGRYPALSAELQAGKGADEAIARLQQPLWTGGRLTGQIKRAEANLGAAEAKVEQARQAILLEAGQVFFEHLRLKARLLAAQANVAEHRRLQEVIERRVQAEVSPATDATQARARLQQAISERLQFERQLEASRSTLTQIVGSDPGQLSMPRAVHLQATSIGDLQSAAWAHSPERRHLQALVEAGQAEVDTTRSALMPQVHLSYDLKLGHLPAGEDRGRLFLGLSMQTGAGLSSLSTMETAVARQQAARDGLEQYQRQLEQSVRAGWNEFSSLSEQLEPARALLGAADEVVASYLRQFQVGRKTWLDVLNAQREKTNARYTLADIEAPLLHAKLRLVVLAGLLQPDAMGEVIHD